MQQQILTTNFGDKLAMNFDNKFWQQILTYLILATVFYFGDFFLLW
jgi:hypothetical protein